MARCLIIGCGCRGRALATTLLAAGHPVRGTTRRADALRSIEAVGAEAVLADPDRVGTLIGAVDQVTVVAILLGSATGSAEQVESLHGTRLDMLLTKLIDTTVRGVVYEACGQVPERVLEAGARRVQAFGRDTRARCELLAGDPADVGGWLAAAVAGVQRCLEPRTAETGGSGALRPAGGIM